MTCPKYEKIDTLYTRDEKFKVTDEIRRPEFLIPQEWLVTEKINGTNIRVSLEQTVDPAAQEMAINFGLPKTWVDENMAEWVMRINGRNDNSQIPPNLLRHLQETFTLEGLKSLWRGKKGCEACDGCGSMTIAKPYVTCACVEPYPITLYGEGYGGSIQKGGSEYTSKTKGGAVSFRLFDVLVGENNWLRRADVEDVAEKLGVKVVPLLGDYFDLDGITRLVKNGMSSVVAACEGTTRHRAEGVVAFTAEPLYNNRGQRLMFKLKSEDFS